MYKKKSRNIDKSVLLGYNKNKGGDALDYIIGIAIGYLFGCINMAYIISKYNGINIKEVGSNNAGASNVFISVGKAAGVVVGAFDILKAFLAAEFVFLLFNRNFELAVIAGIMAIIGHIFPFWMKLNGGKGLAPIMGAVLFYDWKLFIILGILIIAITLITDYIAISALTITIIAPLYAVIIRKEYFVAIMFFAIGAIMWYKHKDNLMRLKAGTEVGFLRKNKG